MVAEYRIAILIAVAAVAAAPSVGAQEYPSRPVRILTGPPATMMDIVGRQLAQRLGEQWGRPVVMDNRGSLGVAPTVTAQSAPDGYTLLISDSTLLSVRPSLYRSLPYDPAKDFAPITLIASSAQMLVAHPSVPAANLDEFLAYAKRQPRGVDFANAGPATASHLTSELFRQATGVNVVPVNYKGGGAALVAILGGETKAGFSLLFLALPQVKAGKIKAYAVTSGKRFPDAPQVPTMAEAGIPAFETTYWFGLLAPARTPPALIGKLNRDAVTVLQSSGMRSVLLEQGAEPAAGTAEAFGAFIQSETLRFRKVIEVAGIKPD
jgi:tripartite-type tricarboxylate transporter receptor subunit TctC